MNLNESGVVRHRIKINNLEGKKLTGKPFMRREPNPPVGGSDQTGYDEGSNDSGNPQGTNQTVSGNDLTEAE